MSFAKLGLAPDLVRAVAEHGYTVPTPIQTQAIPAVLAGGDLLAGAQTGTGKTAGFVLPILQRLMTHRVDAHAGGRRPVRVLILTPTRELAAQVAESVHVYGKYAKQTCAVVYGGVGIQPQIAQLRRGVDILVATPGRLIDLQGQRCVDLSRVEILVLDEADRMLDMGFIRDIRRILAMLPKRRQNLLFSATFSDEIRTLADTLLDRPAMIEVARRNSTVEATTQKVHPVDRDRKRELLSHLIKTRNWFQVLVFTRTKHGANKLAEQLKKDGITALAIHGNKSQGARTRALSEFKTTTLQVLVATDIAVRGIDIDQLPHVVNYDLPNVPEDYVHRIGRTGRAGATGEAISLVCVDEHAFLRDIERLIKREIETEIVPGFEPDRRATAQPIQQRQQRSARGNDPSGGKSRPQPTRGGAGARGGTAGRAKAPGDARTPHEPRDAKRSTSRATHASTSPVPASRTHSPKVSALPAPRTPSQTAKPGVRRFGGRYK